MHPVLDCATRLVTLSHTGRVDVTRRVGEGSLARMLQTSRSTIRASLDHLEMIGLARRVPRAGTFLNVVGPKKFCEVMDVRASLEGLSVRLAATRATEADLGRLRSEAVELDRLNARLIDGDYREYEETARLDMAFHFFIARLADNSCLVSTLAQQRLVERSYRLAEVERYLRAQYDRPVPTHMEIVDGIAGRDPAKAELVMRRHILRTKELRLGSISGEVA